MSYLRTFNYCRNGLKTCSPSLIKKKICCDLFQLNRTDIVRTLLAAGADPRVRNHDNLNALQLASSEQTKHTFIEELLRAIANSQ